MRLLYLHLSVLLFFHIWLHSTLVTYTLVGNSVALLKHLFHWYCILQDMHFQCLILNDGSNGLHVALLAIHWLDSRNLVIIGPPAMEWIGWKYFHDFFIQTALNNYEIWALHLSVRQTDLTKKLFIVWYCFFGRKLA